MSLTTRGPPDGIVATMRGQSWAAARWLELYDPLKKSHHQQLSRGRALARGGKVRELWFSPSLVGAFVADGRQEHQVSLHFRPFDKDRWDKVIARLVERLDRVADLFEGELSESLLTTLESDGVSLLPRRKEIEGTCDCGDYHLPCCHMAAVHNLLADALDGDPFLLLTLRGLDRGQLLDRLRRAWGDTRPLLARDPEREAPAPSEESGWFGQAEPLPGQHVQLPAAPDPLAGIHALGPPPGGDELINALEPLYNAGSEAASDLAYATRPPPPKGVTERWAGFQRGKKPNPDLAALVERSARVAIPPSEAALITKIVEHLAEHGSTSTTVLADRIREPRHAVLGQLEALRVMGVVYTTGQARSTRWTLG